MPPTREDLKNIRGSMSIKTDLEVDKLSLECTKHLCGFANVSSSLIGTPRLTMVIQSLSMKLMAFWILLTAFAMSADAQSALPAPKLSKEPKIVSESYRLGQRRSFCYPITMERQFCTYYYLKNEIQNELCSRRTPRGCTYSYFSDPFVFPPADQSVHLSFIPMNDIQPDGPNQDGICCVEVDSNTIVVCNYRC